MSKIPDILTGTKKGCIAAAAAILGAKWTPQIVYALFYGCARFSELQREVGGVNPRTLSARLDELEAAGIIKKTAYSEVPPRIEYCLTAKGKALVPILKEMVSWSEKYAPLPAEKHSSR